MSEFGRVVFKEWEIQFIKPKWTLENMSRRVLDNITETLSERGEWILISKDLFFKWKEKKNKQMLKGLKVEYFFTPTSASDKCLPFLSGSNILYFRGKWNRYLTMPLPYACRNVDLERSSLSPLVSVVIIHYILRWTYSMQDLIGYIW